MDDRALHKQKLFWCVVGAPVFFGMLLFIPLMTEYELDPSVSGIVKFAELSKLQFSIILLSIPLGALLARIHSTIQKEKENEIANEEIVVSQIIDYVDCVKNELTTELEDKNSRDFTPINDNVSWIRAAKDILCIFKHRKTLKIPKNIERCDEFLERLHLHLYRSFGNSDDCLPIQFFTGSKTWLEDHKELESKELSSENKNKELIEYILSYKGPSSLSSRSSLSNTAPRFPDTTIADGAICCIFDFINNYFESFEPNEDTKKSFIELASNLELVD